MDAIDGINDPAAFLDRVCSSVTGVRKAYISDSQGAILAESSAPEEDPQWVLTLVRSIPSYFERMKKLSFGEPKSMVIDGDECAVVLLSSPPIFISFLCDVNANFALLTEIPNEMKDFIAQLKTFVDSA